MKETSLSNGRTEPVLFAARSSQPRARLRRDARTLALTTAVRMLPVNACAMLHSGWLQLNYLARTNCQ